MLKQTFEVDALGVVDCEIWGWIDIGSEEVDGWDTKIEFMGEWAGIGEKPGGTRDTKGEDGVTVIVVRRSKIESILVLSAVWIESIFEFRVLWFWLREAWPCVRRLTASSSLEEKPWLQSEEENEVF